MDESRRYVLAESDSPIGMLQLIAYRQGGATWVGVARRDAGERPEGGLIEATALRTGSNEHVITASVSSDETFSYVAGAVAPGIVRAEIDADDGRVFPAAIVDIPDEIEQEYQAVWAVLDEVLLDSRVIGYDDRGRLYDETDPRVFTPPPTTEERLEAIRHHADGSMRYYATALLREPDDHPELMERYLSLAATFMAMLEADATDTRTVLARRHKIVARYKEEVKENPWLPPQPS
jgi:hypothetical protein